MGKKHLSLIVIPHTKTSHRTLSFSKRTVRVGRGTGDRAGRSLDRASPSITSGSAFPTGATAPRRRERETEGQICEFTERRSGSWNRRLNTFQEYAGKLNVFAGIKSPDMLTNPGVGGGEPAERIRESAQDSSAAGRPAAVDPEGPGADPDGRRPREKSRHAAHPFRTDSRASSPPGRPSPRSSAIVPAVSAGGSTRSIPDGRAFHYGLDIATVHGNPVVATADGSVIRVAYDGALGNNIIINHGNGITTLYGHLSKTLVKPGAQGQAGGYDRPGRTHGPGPGRPCPL